MKCSRAPRVLFHGWAQSERVEERQRDTKSVTDTHLWYCVCKKLNSSLIRSQFSNMVNLYGWVGCGGPLKMKQKQNRKRIRLQVTQTRKIKYIEKIRRGLIAFKYYFRRFVNWINWSCLRWKVNLKTLSLLFQCCIQFVCRVISFFLIISHKKCTNLQMKNGKGPPVKEEMCQSRWKTPMNE